MMLLIVIMHLSGGSIDTSVIRLNFSWQNLWIICYRSVTFIGVPTFAFISGYFGVKCNFRKLLSLECMAITYGALVVLASFFFGNGMGIFVVRDFLMPASSGYLWYYSAYILLVLISPFINKALSNMSSQEIKKYILFFLLVAYVFRSVFNWKGNDFLLLLSIYFLGQYLRRYPSESLIKHSFVIFLSTQLINFVLIFLLLYLGIGYYTFMLEGSTNPITIVSSISLFYCVLGRSVEGNSYSAIIRFLAKMAPCMLAVYVLHGAIKISGMIDLSFMEAKLCLVLPISVAVVLLISIIEILRKRFFSSFEGILYDKMKSKVNW